MNHLVRGGISGLVATLPMTLAMETMHRRLPPKEQYPLPPREIENVFSKTLGAAKQMSAKQHLIATLIAHFGYGSACGYLYSKLIGKQPTVKQSIIKGSFFGLGIWMISYQFLLPKLGILKPLTQFPPRRNLLMAAAHIVWGASLGILSSSPSNQRATRVRNN